MSRHNAALDITMVGRAEAQATMRLPYNEKLIGNPSTRVLHGGAITTLVDTASGASVIMKLGGPQPIATLDLRLDYLKRATPGEDVLATADCYRISRNLAFVRSIAYHEGEQDSPIVASSATFMLTGVSSKAGPPKSEESQ